MTTQQKVEILKTHPLFRVLEPEELETVAQKARQKTYSPHSIILHQNDHVKSVYLIYKGLAAMYFLTEDGKIIPMRLEEPSYVVGELNLFDDLSVSSVEAIKETETLTIPMDDFRKLVLEHPKFELEVLKLDLEELREANEEMINLFSLSLKERTWLFLKTLSPHFPNKEITLSHEEISFIVGATRARITEVLNALEEERRIFLMHRKIRVF